MDPVKVGIREFRSHLPRYLLESSAPVAITRHGETIGYFIPSREVAPGSDLEALKAAAAQLDKLLSAHGVDGEELAVEFQQARKRKTRG